MIIHGVTILFNPDHTVYDNIQSYIEQVSCLYVIDNSDEKNIDLIQAINKFENIIYIALDENKGVAFALNYGAKLAIHAGADWLLTMDQDSSATPAMLKTMKKCLEQKQNEKIGLISPLHIDRYHRINADHTPCEFILTAMTSGNLLNLQVYQELGPFYEDFFIDRVDIEYCLRLHKFGYKILIANHADLYHSVGRLTKKRFIFWFVYPSNHSPVRYYYMARNSAKIIHLYFTIFPFFCLKEIKFLLGIIVKIIFFEEKKLQKLQMVLSGFRDFTLHRFGKLNQ